MRFTRVTMALKRAVAAVPDETSHVKATTLAAASGSSSTSGSFEEEFSPPILIRVAEGLLAPTSVQAYALAARATAAIERLYSKRRLEATIHAGSSPPTTETYENAPPALGASTANSK